MDQILSIKNLTKKFPKVLAVDNISFDIPSGICFGLLGPNGAGKTTTIEMMEGILKPTSGQILYKGEKTGNKFKESIGIQFQHTALQDFLSVKETLKLFSNLYPKPKPLDEVIEICSLNDIIERDNRKLSGGQRQRLLLAIAIINDPELLFLDEPTTGLDPQARRNFWKLVQNIKAENKTIVLTTHYMDEAEILCDDLIIMDHGNIITRGTPANLLKDHFPDLLIKIPKNGNQMPSGLPFPVTDESGFYQIASNNLETTIHELLHHKIKLNGIQIVKPNLDDLFLKLTGTKLRV